MAQTVSGKIQTYLEKELPVLLQSYFEHKASTFPNAQAYFGQNNYFNEDTLKIIMAYHLLLWIKASGHEKDILLISEKTYIVSPNRRVDFMIIHDSGEPVRIYVELKSDFKPESVNEDLDILAGEDGESNEMIAGYVFYLIHPGETWDKSIHHVGGTITAIPIEVTEPML